MNIRNVAKFLYWDILPISIGLITFYLLNKIDDMSEFIRMTVNAFGLFILFIMIHVWVGYKIFPEDKKMTLANKIMNCRLRMQYGSSYCVKCPDSYSCASDVNAKKEI